MNIKLIVGLGNTGNEYMRTRHNIGARYVEFLAYRYKKVLKKEKKLYGYTSQINFGDNNVHLLIPSTFMNLSGKAIAATITFYNILPEEILVAHDEMNLLPGNIRLKRGSNHSSHNGIKNIIHSLGNYFQFYRLRIGIGHPGHKNNVLNFVLSKPLKKEQYLIDNAINEAICCTEMLITQNIKKAINRLHSYRLT